MPDYAILVYPSANRVYADASRPLLRAELAAFAETISGLRVDEITERDLGGVPYLAFRTPESLAEDMIDRLSNLSTLYALYRVEGDLLRPLTVRPTARFDSDLLTIQKYSGKTNELFTKLLVNLTVLATDRPDKPRLHLLDPLCGRGTTLNQAMMYGFDATGVEVDGKDFEAYCQFIKTWLRTKRVKHTADTTSLRRNKVNLGRRIDLEFAATKELYKAKETQRISYLNCDTLTTDELLRAGSVDLVVADAPYGVQHGSHRQEALARSPRDLLAAAVPVWTRVLRAGGAIGISWNTNVLSRADLLEILRKSGLEPREGGPWEQFAHRVDQAIARDLVVARKPR